MNTKHKHIKLLIVTFFIGVLALAGFVATAAADHKPGHNPGGGGGGDDSGGNEPVCIAFQDLPGDGVQSDLQDPYAPDVGDPYCNHKKSKIEAMLTSGGWVSLSPNTNSHNQPEAGRRLFVDLGRPLYLLGPASDGLSIAFQQTDPLPADTGQGYITAHNEHLQCAVLASAVDLRAMDPGEMRPDATMRITVNLTYSNGKTGALIINFNPDYERFGCRRATESDRIRVTRGGGDSGIPADTWEFEVDGTRGAALQETYRTDGPGGDVLFFCHTVPVNEGGEGEEPFTLPPFKLWVTLLP